MKQTTYLYFEDMNPSIKFESANRTITANDIDAFTLLSGDTNPLHSDEKFASQTQFGTRIAPGALILSIATGLAYGLSLIHI